MNWEEILIWVKTSPSAGRVTKHRITAPVTVATAVHFYPRNDVFSSTVKRRLESTQSAESATSNGEKRRLAVTAFNGSLNMPQDAYSIRSK